MSGFMCDLYADPGPECCVGLGLSFSGCNFFSWKLVFQNKVGIHFSLLNQFPHLKIWSEKASSSVQGFLPSLSGLTGWTDSISLC